MAARSCRTRWLSSLALALALALVSLGPGAARGEGKKAHASLLFKEGNELYSKGYYAAALRRFRQARALFPSYKIDVNIGTTLNALGRRAEAAEHYDQFLRRFAARAPAPIVKSARAALAIYERALAKVELSCPVGGATVKMNSRVVGKTPLSKRIFAEPGSYVLSLSRPGYLTFSARLSLKAGGSEKIVAPMNRAPAPPTRPRSGTIATRPRPAPPSVSAPDDPGVDGVDADVGIAETRRRKTIWAYSTLSAGLAFGVAAAVLYGVGASQGSEAHELYMKAERQEDFERYSGDIRAARTKVVVGHVMLGAAAAGIGLSIYHFLTRPRRSRADLSLRLRPGAAALQLGGRF